MVGHCSKHWSGSLRAALCAFLVWTATSVSAQSIKVTLLGTGNPRPVMTRFGPSILVEAGSGLILSRSTVA